MKAVSLFSGAGGMDIGVDRAGFHTICAIEIDQHCVATLNANQSPKKPKEVIRADIRQIQPAQLMRKLQLRAGEVSLLCGSPPRYLPKEQDNPQDKPWWSLMFELARFAQVMRPRAVLFVQVPGVRKADNGVPILQFKKELESAGFPALVEGVVDAIDFGVPQNRKLYFCAAFEQDAPPAAFEFPSAKIPRTVGEVIRGLPPTVLRGEAPHFPNHVDVTPLGDRRRIAPVREGSYLGNDDNDAPPEIRGKMGKKDSTKFRRTAWNLPARTLRSGEPFYHPEENRYLTPRESMRVHGFPDDYVLQGPIRGRSGRPKGMDQNRQISNAVPPPLAEGLASQIRKALRRRPG